MRMGASPASGVRPVSVLCEGAECLDERQGIARMLIPVLLQLREEVHY